MTLDEAKADFYAKAISTNPKQLDKKTIVEILKAAGFGQFHESQIPEYHQAIHTYLIRKYFADFQQMLICVDEYFEDEKNLRLAMRHVGITQGLDPFTEDQVDTLATWIRKAKDSGAIAEVYCPICAKAGKKVKVVRVGDTRETAYLNRMYKNRFAYPWRCPKGGLSHFHQAAWDAPLHYMIEQSKAREARLEAEKQGLVPVAETAFAQKVDNAA